MNKHLFNKANVMLFILMAALIFCGTITAFAASGNSTFWDNEISDSDFSSLQSSYAYANWTTSVSPYGKCQGWAGGVIKSLMDMGVIRGVYYGSQIVIPSDNVINGKDALGITIFFHWPERGSKTQESRSRVYANADSIFNDCIGGGTDYFNNIAKRDSMSRQEAALILAYCIQAKSGGEKSLDDYSPNAIGYKIDGSLVDNFSNGSIKGMKVTDLTEYNNKSGVGIYKQAFNLLIDCGVCDGRTSGGTTALAYDGTIQYNEYYSWLVQVGEKMQEEGWTDGGSSSFLNAALTLSAGTVTVNYRDFLDGIVEAEIEVISDASDTDGDPMADSFEYTLKDNQNKKDSYDGDSIWETFFSYT